MTTPNPFQTECFVQLNLWQLILAGSQTDSVVKVCRRQIEALQRLIDVKIADIPTD